ncbi:MAG: matrixin family metalloprotease [Myxococcales bacterium]|nr:matrixin family metalloprotease [Myxococcales bacterium]
MNQRATRTDASMTPSTDPAAHAPPFEPPRATHGAARRTLLVRAAFLTLLVLGAATPGTARAYRCLRLGCPTWCGPVPVSVTAHSEDLEAIAAGTTLMSVESAFTDWTRVPCASLTVDVSEALGSAPFFGDGESQVGFIESDWPYDANAIGISDVQVISGCIREADVALNGQNFTWVLGAGGPGTVNAYGAILHEAGHYYGLGHSMEPRSVMWFLYRGGRPVLEQDDFDGICALYPRSGPDADCSVAGCPLGFDCEAGVCVATVVPGCVRHEDCDVDQRCDPVSGACVDGAPVGEALGAPCVDDLGCTSGLCAQLSTGGVCTQACDGLLPRAVACPDDFLCDGDAVGVCGTGLCLAGRPGDASLGAPCEEDSDCASSMCDEGVCATPCSPDVTGSCPNGFVCEPGQAAGCGACKPPLGLGARCRYNEDCADGMCVTNEGAETGACATLCDPDEGREACPDGFRCEAMSELALCVADPIGQPTLAGGSCTAGSRRVGGAGAKTPVSLTWLLGVVWAVRRRRRRVR